MTDHADSEAGPAKRGFAVMDPSIQREIARKGGASVPSIKRSFSQDRGLAAEAGRKGGLASVKKRSRQEKREETEIERAMHTKPPHDF